MAARKAASAAEAAHPGSVPFDFSSALGGASGQEAQGGADDAYDCSFDVVIVGCGVAGLYAALNLPRSLRIAMLSKSTLVTCDSMLAQGGICMLPDEDDYQAYFDDTMHAGHNENRADSVDVMIRSSQRTIADLIGYGARFARNPDGTLAFTREGAHSRPRICYHEDVTGREITTALLRQVLVLPNVRVYENTTMTDLIDGSPRGGDADAAADDAPTPCAGVVAQSADGLAIRFHAPDTILATGGIGGLYEHSTNYPILTGDGCRIAAAHGADLEHMDYVQIHPTTLYTRNPGRRAQLISESCRGEGAVLLGADGQRFTDELQPRDVVTKAIYAQMEREGSRHVWLSFARCDPATTRTHFPHIYEDCLAEGYDMLHEPIPVVPAQHYFMGGIHVDLDSATTVPHLYAAGETSCNGVHGANRLASNSLLESLVFARRAALAIARGRGLAAAATPYDLGVRATGPSRHDALEVF